MILCQIFYSVLCQISYLCFMSNILFLFMYEKVHTSWSAPPPLLTHYPFVLYSQTQINQNDASFIPITDNM